MNVLAWIREFRVELVCSVYGKRKNAQLEKRPFFKKSTLVSPPQNSRLPIVGLVKDVVKCAVGGKHQHVVADEDQ